MTSPTTLRVCMLVRNACTNDARVLKEARTLDDAGYEVTVIAVRRPERLPESERREGVHIVRVAVDPVHYRVLRLVTRIRLGLRRRIREQVAAVSHRTPEAPQRPSRLARVIRPFTPPLATLDYVLRSRRVARSLAPDICHAHDLNTLLAGVVISHRCRARLVYDSHELNLEAGRTADVHGMRKRILRLYERTLTRRADATITVNDSIADLLAGWHGIPRPVVVRNCPPRMPASHSSDLLRTRAGVPPGVDVVLYQGGFAQNRGLPQLVRAITLLDDAMLVLLGDGPLRELLADTAVEAGAGDRVRFLATVPHDQLLQLTRGAAVGVVPYQRTSLNNYLATPNKIFEYLMAGCLVATSDFPEMARILRESEAGAVFDPEDPEDIARAVRSLLERPDRAAHRTRVAEFARERYCWEGEAEKLLAVYGALTPLPALR